MTHPPPPVNPPKPNTKTPPNNEMTPKNTRKPPSEQFNSYADAIQVQNNTPTNPEEPAKQQNNP
jgi:hypothetical protein